MADTVVQELVINTLTQAQFDAAKEAGTLSPYELYGTPDASVRLPVLTPMWFDHITNDVSWLRADTFSWHSGDVYVAAYEHLVNDVGAHYYAWVDRHGTYGFNAYTTSETPIAGDNIYNEQAVVIGTCSSYSSGALAWTGTDGTGYSSWLRETGSDLPRKRTDTIGDITITYYLAEDGHKICLPDQESNLRAVMQATGVAWYYLLDTENKQFKLPRTKFGFTGLRDSVGGYVAPGLPDHTHNTPYGKNDSSDHHTEGTSRPHISTNEYYKTIRGYSKPSTLASASNAIYGNSDTVQPPATQMYLYFYVGNFEQEAVEQTAGINAEMFNDLNAHKVVDFQAPTADNGYTWYRKYADGWVEQGGRCTVPATNASSSSNSVITLPVPIQAPEAAVLSYSGLNAAESFANCENQASLTSTTVSIGRWNWGQYTAAARSYMWVLYGLAQ